MSCEGRSRQGNIGSIGCLAVLTCIPVSECSISAIELDCTSVGNDESINWCDCSILCSGPSEIRGVSCKQTDSLCCN